MMFENTLKKQNSSIMAVHDPMCQVLQGIGLLRVLSILNKSLLASMRIKTKMQVAPNTKTDANIVMYPKVMTISM